ncbi:MAG: hypothetical protein R3F62_28885 [Planctomycetota bacterium]
MHHVALRSCCLIAALLMGCSGRSRWPPPPPLPAEEVQVEDLQPEPSSEPAPAEPEPGPEPEPPDPEREPESHAPEAEPGPEPAAATPPPSEEPAPPEAPLAAGPFAWPKPNQDLDLLLTFPPESVEDQVAPPLVDVTFRLPSPLGTPDPARQAIFVRLASATLGGDFDSAGAEEVVFTLVGQSHETRLARHVLALPSDSVRAFELREDSAWIELGALRFRIRVVDDDATGVEHMTDSVHQVVLQPGALGPTPQTLPVELERIRGESWGFLQPKRTIDLGGATLDLDTIQVPRAELDEASRQEIAACFPLAALQQAARSPLGLKEQAASLTAMAERAAETLARSTHTAQRAALDRLVRRAVQLAAYSRNAVLQIPKVRAAYYPKAIEELAEARVAAQEPRLEDAFARVEELLASASLEAHPELRAAVDRLEEASAALGEDGDADFERNWAITSWAHRTRDLLETLEAGPEARVRYRRGLAAFREELRAVCAAD